MKKKSENETSSQMRKSLVLRKMLISCLLLCSSSFVFAQKGNLPKVNIEAKQATFVGIIESLQEQSGYEFVFKATDVQGINEVSISLKDTPLEQVLEMLLSKTDLVYSIENRVVLIKKKEKQQKLEEAEVEQIVVNGKVVDENGMELPGVTIRLKNHDLGVVTDQHGLFCFSCPKVEPMVFVFSYIGYKTQEVSVTPGQELIVTLFEDLITMNEVVVTGYTSLSRRETASAVTQIKAEQVMLNSKSSIDQMLVGQIPGMTIIQTSGEPSATPKIRIRGISSITSSKAPLWVVDGVILEDPVNIDHSQLDSDDAAYLIGNAIAGINPRDIETITVLKDASATAIYGVQAANGVIVLTTKTGQEGEAQLSYSSSLTWNQRVSYGDLYLMNAGERIALSQEIIDKKLNYGRVPVALGYEGLYMRYLNREFSHEEFSQKVKKMAHDNTDWYDILFRNVMSHNHSLSISGGSKDTRYYASVGFDQNFGTANGSDSKRYTALLKLDSRLGDRMRLGMNLNGSIRENEGFHSSVNPNQYAYETARTIPCFNEDGSLFFYETRQKALMSSAEAPKEELNYNILHELSQTGSSGKVAELAGQMNFQYRTKWGITYDFTGSYNYQQAKQDSWAKDESNYVGLKRGYKKGSLEPNSPEEDKSVIPVGGILEKSETEKISYMIRNKLAYGNQFGKHEISASLISEIRSTRTKGMGGTYYGWMPERGETITPMFTTGYLNLLPSLSPIITDNQANYVSWAGVVAYTWNNKFTINGNIRLDGSNKFGENPEYRFLPIWSVAGRYTLTEESFLKNNEFLSLLALRASYGIQGNVDKGTSPELVIQVGEFNTATRLNESYFEYLPNPDLRWEKTTSYNLGLDFACFDDRLSGTFDFYHKKGVDMIMSKQVSQAMGIDYVKINAGKLNNTGYELDLKFYPIRRADYSFHINFIYSYNKNKVVDANHGENITNAEKLAGTALIEGKPFGTFYSYAFAGLHPETGYPLFYDKNGLNYHEVDGEQAPNYALYEEELGFVESGTKDPTSSGSIGLNFRYKNLRLSMNMSYTLGGHARLPNIYRDEYYAIFDPVTNLSKELNNRWRQPGDEQHTVFPVLYNDREYDELNQRSILQGEMLTAPMLYDYTDIRVAKTDNLRLRSVALNYRLPETITDKLHLQELSLNVQVTNLFIIKAKEWRGRDPESGDSNTPLPRTYSLGLNVTF